MEKTANDTEIERFLLVGDIAKIFGVKKDKALAIIKAPGFPAIKIGKSYYVDKEAFLIWKDKYLYREFSI